ncbi:MAG: hypothetical protein ABSD03_14585 [Vulcanimicrobiaceae bacterium]|jgi:hypothetical protein
MDMGKPQVVFCGTCVFCGGTITENDVDPCQVVVETKSGGWQTWGCHAQCFKDRVVDPPGAPGAHEPAIF